MILQVLNHTIYILSSFYILFGLIKLNSCKREKERQKGKKKERSVTSFTVSLSFCPQVTTQDLPNEFS